MALRYFSIYMLLGFSQNVFAAEIGRIDIPEKKIILILSTANEALKALPLNKMVALTVEMKKSSEVDPAPKIRLSGFEAQMPDHGHGMVVTPKITSISEEKWQIDGVKLHMIGVWEISLLAEFDGKDHRYSLKITM